MPPAQPRQAARHRRYPPLLRLALDQARRALVLLQMATRLQEAPKGQKTLVAEEAQLPASRRSRLMTKSQVRGKQISHPEPELPRINRPYQDRIPLERILPTARRRAIPHHPPILRLRAWTSPATTPMMVSLPQGFGHSERLRISPVSRRHLQRGPALPQQARWLLRVETRRRTAQRLPQRTRARIRRVLCARYLRRMTTIRKSWTRREKRRWERPSRSWRRRSGRCARRPTQPSGRRPSSSLTA